MRANDVSMAIYRDADRLFVFAAAPREAHWDRSRQDPILAKWDKACVSFWKPTRPATLPSLCCPRHSVEAQ